MLHCHAVLDWARATFTRLGVTSCRGWTLTYNARADQLIPSPERRIVYQKTAAISRGTCRQVEKRSLKVPVHQPLNSNTLELKHFQHFNLQTLKLSNLQTFLPNLQTSKPPNISLKLSNPELSNCERMPRTRSAATGYRSRNSPRISGDSITS